MDFDLFDYFQWRRPGGKKEAFDEMVEKVSGYNNKKLLEVARSFANFLALANAAENHHRIRVLKELQLQTGTDYGLWPKNDSTAGTIRRLLNDHNVPAEKLLDALNNQKVELVLTAHPTEVNRRTMLRKLRKIKELLDLSDRPDLSNYERKNLEGKLTAEISSIWDSDFLRRTKPTPQIEAMSGLAVAETVMWDAVPNFLRRLDDVVFGETGKRLPLDYAPIKVASWMGGDRDGNPNVTPEVTLEVSMLSRWMAATLLKKDLKDLHDMLSVTVCNDEVRAAAGSEREPYRVLLKKLDARLQATLEWTQSYLLDNSVINRDVRAAGATPLRRTDELREPLMMMHKSLMDCGLDCVANGMLVDIIRKVSAFGLALMPLDLRQESTRHTEALDAITRYLGIGAYSQWDELTRRSWLQGELTSKRALLPRRFNHGDYPEFFTPTVMDTLRTFEVAAELSEESLGAYVISQCQQASDVLAVMLLQQEAGVKPFLRIVPLFETLDDLQRAADTVNALFSMPVYRGHIGGKQEIMVGYSDSAKDAGRLAASWAQYNSQLDMISVADRHGIEVTFFHGKGGTVGRGGNPALYEAILAHPPNTINGRFRITEQGEIITQNFGQESVAVRTLDLFTAGVLAERFIPRPEVKPEWRAMMERLSEVSCGVYRHVVRGEERFVSYFRAATPELELAKLNVGSRPAKRNPKGGVESLRAIPWVFAWTQTRLNLPTWLGVGEALSKEMKENPAVLKEMYAEWPWFKTLIDLLEMILVKSDAKIAENYDKLLVSDAQSLALGAELREKMKTTTEAVLAVSGSSELQKDNKILLRSLAVRNPYVDPLNAIQAELLRRMRDAENGVTSVSEEEKLIMQDALLITINGIANGMRNSG